MEASLAKCRLSMVEMKVLRVAPFVASTSHVQSPTCAHENAQIHVVFVVGKRYSSKTCLRKSMPRGTRGPWHGVARNLKSNIVISQLKMMVLHIGAPTRVNAPNARGVAENNAMFGY